MLVEGHVYMRLIIIMMVRARGCVCMVKIDMRLINGGEVSCVHGED